MINNLLAAIWEWQWADFVIATIGSLLGLFFAILSAWGANKLLEKAQCKNIVKKLSTELYSFSNDEVKKGEIVEKIKIGEDIGHKIISIPYLEQLFATNQILLISKQQWYYDLVELMNTINDINQWYGIKADYYFENIIETTKIKGEWQENYKTKVYLTLCNILAEQVESVFYQQTINLFNKINITGERTL